MDDGDRTIDERNPEHRWILRSVQSVGQYLQGESISLHINPTNLSFLKNDVERIDVISNDVKALSALLDDLIAEGATDDPTLHRHRLESLLSHYKQLLNAINETSQRCSATISSKIVHEKAVQLTHTFHTITNAPINFRTLADVRTVLQGQIKVTEILEKFSLQVRELVLQGTELLSQPFTPNYVQHDLDALQRIFHEKLESAQDFQAHLKNLLELWERFDANQRQCRQRIERSNGEWNSSRHVIPSFQHEIDHCKVTRPSSPFSTPFSFPSPFKSPMRIANRFSTTMPTTFARSRRRISCPTRIFSRSKANMTVCRRS